MKVGDILYVKQPYTARYGRQGAIRSARSSLSSKYSLTEGSYEYHFVPGDMYEITYVHSVNSATVQNTNGDGVQHYVDDMRERFYTLEEWREIKLKEIGI